MIYEVYNKEAISIKVGSDEEGAIEELKKLNDLDRNILEIRTDSATGLPKIEIIFEEGEFTLIKKISTGDFKYKDIINLDRARQYIGRFFKGEMDDFATPFEHANWIRIHW